MQDIYLCHHGIKGQKWGIRRYQNPDGSLTSAGKNRIEENYKKQINKISDKLSDNQKTALKVGTAVGSTVLGSSPILKRNDRKYITVSGNNKENSIKKNNEDNLNKAYKDIGKYINTSNNINNITNRGNKIARDSAKRSREKAKENIDLSNMSNEDLRKAIERYRLEEQYKDIKTKDVGIGRKTVGDYLETIGDISSIGASAASIFAILYYGRRR